jgi:4-hydroxy-3-polyprenylbenzoate decarboxylase
LPLATNLLHGSERICQALGVKSLIEVQDRSRELLRPAQSGWLDALRQASPQARWSPRVVRNGACQQVVRLASDVDLGEWLNVRWWPEEEAASLPATLAFVQAPDDAWRSMELCSATLVDRQRLALGWEPHRGIARLWHEYSRRGEPLPIALSLGGHPLETLAAAAPLAWEADRWSLCGWLRDRPCDLVRSRTLPIDVPADAEIIVEGFLDPGAPRVPAPRRAELSGFYSQPTEGVVMQVTAVTHRTNPLQVAIAPLKPPHEVAAMREAMLEALKPLLLAAVPGLVDYHLPAAAGCRAWEPWMFARLLVLVDEDADVRDEQEMLFRVASHADLSRDVFQQAAPCEASHHAAPVPGVAGLLGIDATRKSPQPAELSMAAKITEQVESRWTALGLSQNEKTQNH